MLQSFLIIATVPLALSACLQKVSNCNSSVNYFQSMPTFEYSSTISKVVNNNTWISFDMTFGQPPTMQTYVFVQCGCRKYNHDD